MHQHVHRGNQLTFALRNLDFHLKLMSCRILLKHSKNICRNSGTDCNYEKFKNSVNNNRVLLLASNDNFSLNTYIICLCLLGDNFNAPPPP